MTNSAPIPDQNRIEALLPLARGWLELVACMLPALFERANRNGVLRHRRILRRFVLRLERTFANWLQLSAYLQMPETPRLKQTRRPRFAPSGFRRALCRHSDCRRFRHALRGRGSLVERLRYLYAIVSDPERAAAIVTRLIDFLERGLARARLAIAAPHTLSFQTNAIGAPVPAADSS
jgi:hypothetical protein